MLCCREVVRLLSSNIEMSWPQRATLRMHLMICKHCGAYSKELTTMQQAFRKLFAHITQIDPKETEALEEEVIDRMIHRSES